MALLDDILKFGTSALSLGGRISPQLGLGALGIGAGAALDKEPGEVLEARQALRNQFTSPFNQLQIPEARTGTQFLQKTVEAPSDPFAAGGAYEKYLPILRREEDDVLTGLQTQLSKAFPAGVGVTRQGPVQENLRRATESLGQRRQALIADLLREQQTRQQSAAESLQGLGQDVTGRQRLAARDVLEFSRPDPTASAIANLGTILAMDSLLRRGGGSGVGGGIEDALSQLGTQGQEALGGIMDSLGLDASAIPAILSTQIPGLGVNVGTLLGSLGAGAGGAVAGKEIGQQIFGRTSESERAGNIGGLGGAGIGALIGSMIAPGIGTVLGAGLGGAGGGIAGSGVKQPDISRRETFQGALGGAFGGLGSFFAAQGDVPASEALRDAALSGGASALFGPLGGIVTSGILGKRRGAKLEKAAFRRDDVSSQRDQVYEIGNIGSQFLAEAGVDQSIMDGWEGFVDSIVQRPGFPSDAPPTEDEQAEAASELNRLLTDAGFPTGKRPPQWKQQFVDYLVQNTFTSGNSRFGGGAPLNLIGAIPQEFQGSFAQRAGFSRN